MRRAQFAVEHILVIAIGIMILIPVINILYGYSKGQTDDITTAQIQNMGNSIIDTSETIYFMGDPAKITLEETMPGNINEITVLGNKELVFYIGDKNSSYPFLSDVPIDGPFYETVDVYCNESSVTKETCFSQGLKKITILAGDDNSSIIIR